MALRAIIIVSDCQMWFAIVKGTIQKNRSLSYITIDLRLLSFCENLTTFQSFKLLTLI